MANESLIKQFGFTEMYEWIKIPRERLGLFVQFSVQEPNKIEPYNGGKLLGITTICSVIESDDPDHWHNAYEANEVGDVYLKNERLAVGIKQYDQDEEMSYIETKPWDHYVRIATNEFNKSQQYVRRSQRPEWVRVNLLGKVIVRDNGKCVAGGYCKPVISDDAEFMGTAEPAVSTDMNSFYVLERLSTNTILVLNK